MKKKPLYIMYWMMLIASSFFVFILFWLAFFNRHWQDKIALFFSSFYSRQGIFCTGSKIKVHGIKNFPSGNFLVVSNHQHIIDIPVLLSIVPRRLGFFAKKELFRVPMLAMWMRILGGISIDRGSPRKSALSIKKGIKKLENDRTLLIFPEGTRGSTDKISKFKSGSFKLAIKAKVPIIPITCCNSNGAFKKNNIIKVYIHKPIFELGQDTHLLSKRVQKIIESKFSSKIS